MFARLLAILICLWVADPRFGRAQPASPPGRQLVVYLKTDSGQPSQPIADMAREANALMAAAGYTISWRNLDGSSRDAGDASVVVIELRGVCEAPQLAAPVESLMAGASLASTAVADGKVLPYSRLECENLTRLLAPSLAKESTGKRDYFYGRAMGRLVAHELFHVLIGTRDHDGAGIAKRSFSAKEILADHFEFELTALDKLRDPTGGGSGKEMETFDGGARGR
jgi:hypothetical protein